MQQWQQADDFPFFAFIWTGRKKKVRPKLARFYCLVASDRHLVQTGASDHQPAPHLAPPRSLPACVLFLFSPHATQTRTFHTFPIANHAWRLGRYQYTHLSYLLFDPHTAILMSPPTAHHGSFLAPRHPHPHTHTHA